MFIYEGEREGCGGMERGNEGRSGGSLIDKARIVSSAGQICSLSSELALANPLCAAVMDGCSQNGQGPGRGRLREHRTKRDGGRVIKEKEGAI